MVTGYEREFYDNVSRLRRETQMQRIEIQKINVQLQELVFIMKQLVDGKLSKTTVDTIMGNMKNG